MALSKYLHPVNDSCVPSETTKVAHSNVCEILDINKERKTGEYQKVIPKD